MEEKYQKRVKYIILFLAAFLIVFLISYFIKSPAKTASSEYNDFYVQKTQFGYKTMLYIGDAGPYYINTVYSPEDIENITINFDIKKAVRNRQVYVAIDPFDVNLTGKTVVAAMELNNVIEPFFKVPVSSAFTKEKGNYAVRTCPSQNKSEAVFVLKLGSEAKILKTSNCITLEAQTQEGLIREADAIVFKLLGITK